MARRRDRAGARGSGMDQQDKQEPHLAATVAGVPPPAAAGGDAESALPPGYLLHEFQIEHVLGQGGFGIVYQAHDTQLRRTVALKEYMPSSLAVRQSGNVVGVRSEHRRETFDLGLRSFVNEARLLASFDNAALVKVYRFWEQNGTAYMVMPFYEGPTLKAWLQAQEQPPAEAWLKQLLGPLLDVLALIHADHCYHRDIAPDNILLLGEMQRPLLLDFGAARRVIGDATQALTAILKPGYAPVEQYAEVPSMKQGPWTDVYALCAVLYRAITGSAPVASVSRMMNDDMVPLSISAAGRYSAPFLAAIDAGLAVRPEQRPADMAALRARLLAQAADEATILRQVDDDATMIVARHEARQVPAPSSVSSPAAAVPFVERRKAVAVPVAPAPARDRNGKLMLGGATALALAGAAAWFTALSGKAPPAPVIASQAAIVPAAAPVATQPPPAEPERPPYTAIAGLDDIVRHRNLQISVNTLANKERIVIGADLMQFRVKSSEAGYVYVFLVGTENAQLQLLFPNALDQDNRIAADATVTLPRKGWQITAAGPPGVNHIVTMVSRFPRDFSSAGLKTSGTIPEFDPAQARRAWSGTPATPSVFAGQVSCAADAACDASYGATLMRIEEVKQK